MTLSVLLTLRLGLFQLWQGQLASGLDKLQLGNIHDMVDRIWKHVNHSAIPLLSFRLQMIDSRGNDLRDINVKLVNLLIRLDPLVQR